MSTLLHPDSRPGGGFFSRHTQKVNRQTHVLWLMWAVSLFFLSPAYADDVRPLPSLISESSLRLTTGTRLRYEAYAIPSAFRSPVREDYAVAIQDIWEGGAIFEYTIDQSVLGQTRGTQVLTSLDTCDRLDPWWGAQSEFDDRCELWFSREAMRDLSTTGTGYFVVDSEFRKDSVVRWERVESVQFLCRVGGRPVLLPALRLKSSRGDEAVVLDDLQNPLVLGIRSTYFSWNLRSVE